MTKPQAPMTNKAPITNDQEQARAHWSLVLGHLLVIGIWSLVIPVSRSFAQSTDASWLLTTADFRTERVTLRSLDDSGATLSSPDAAGRKVAYEQFLSIERTSKPPAPVPTVAAKFIVTSAGNDSAAGQPKSIDGENLVWENPILGSLTLPMRTISSIHRIGAAASAAGSSRDWHHFRARCFGGRDPVRRGRGADTRPARFGR
jgi:hypothetical protein